MERYQGVYIIEKDYFEFKGKNIPVKVVYCIC